jgi:hypothetical protein
MPDGSTASDGDVAPFQSPQAIGLTLVAGEALTFTNITGTVSNGPCCGPVGPEGFEITPHLTGAENGIGNAIAPINALMGVFLGPDLPTNTPAPATLDFSNQASRDYTTLSPQLKQVFFIGNGMTTLGAIQQVVVPTGATRLFIGTMDGHEWFNNTGSFSVMVCRVSEPPPPPPPPPGPGNFCLKDESNGSFITINTRTGEYFFNNCRGFTASGKGQIIIRGSQINLIHQTPDRRIDVDIDVPQRRGNAGVQIFSQQLAFTIADRNIADSICVCDNQQ